MQPHRKHINTIHFTTTADCQVVAIDELPGGTALDYEEHLCELYDIHNSSDMLLCCLMAMCVVNRHDCSYCDFSTEGNERAPDCSAHEASQYNGR